MGSPICFSIQDSYTYGLAAIAVLTTRLVGARLLSACDYNLGSVKDINGGAITCATAYEAVHAEILNCK